MQGVEEMLLWEKLLLVLTHELDVQTGFPEF